MKRIAVYCGSQGARPEYAAAAQALGALRARIELVYGSGSARESNTDF